jgi:hypothetical protein
MFGHVAGRQHRSRWAILSFLFALAFAWSFTVMGDQVGGNWTILRLGLGVGLGISLLRLVLTFVTSRRPRRAKEKDESAGVKAEGQPSAEEPSTEKRPLTYEEVFQVQLNVDDGTVASAPEPEEWPEGWHAEGDEGAEIGAEGQPTEESAPASEEDLQPLQADVDGAIDQDQAIEADVESAQSVEPADESQDALQRMREEFAARAKEAELRVKQREAELDEAASAPKSKS